MYLELLGNTNNPDVVQAYLCGSISLDDVEKIAGVEDADRIRKYENKKSRCEL